MIGRSLFTVDIGCVDIECLVTVAEAERYSVDIAIEGIGGICTCRNDFYGTFGSLALDVGCSVVITCAHTNL